MIARLITTSAGRQSNPAEKAGPAAIAGFTEFTPSPLWAEPREPEPRFLRRTKLSSFRPAAPSAKLNFGQSCRGMHRVHILYRGRPAYQRRVSLPSDRRIARAWACETEAR